MIFLHIYLSASMQHHKEGKGLGSGGIGDVQHVVPSSIVIGHKLPSQTQFQAQT